MGTPQIIMVILLSANWGIHLVKHGEERSPFNVWYETLGAALTIGLLIWGGFF